MIPHEDKDDDSDDGDDDDDDDDDDHGVHHHLSEVVTNVTIEHHLQLYTRITVPKHSKDTFLIPKIQHLLPTPVYHYPRC